MEGLGTEELGIVALSLRVAAASVVVSLPFAILVACIGSAAITARTTRRSFQQRGIHAGQELYALIKAASFDRRSVGYA